MNDYDKTSSKKFTQLTNKLPKINIKAGDKYSINLESCHKIFLQSCQSLTRGRQDEKMKLYIWSITIKQ